MRFLKKLYNKIKSIYTNDIVYFLLLFVLLSVTDVYYNALNSYYDKCFQTCIYAYVFSSIICIILSLINKFKRLRGLFNIVIVLFFCIYSVINFYSISLTLKPFNGGVLEIFLSTNYNETLEFINSYLSVYHVITIILLVIILVVISCKRYIVDNLYVINFLSALFVLNPFLIIIYDYNTLNTPLGRIYNLYVVKDVLELTPDLKSYKSNPDFISTSDDHPENVVVIIGESFAKTHSSLYGYHKKTNPLLENHLSDNNLFIFDNIVAPATHTLAAFKSIMSTFSYNRIGDVWYKHTTIPECFSQLGYQTIWISNQEKFGLRDNIPTRYAQLCDSVIFTQKKITDKFKDEEILNYINETPFKNDLFVFHLMGQHTKYSERYPDKFSYFSEKDYLTLPNHQRKNMAEYDNATLYNDFVVDSIVKVFSDKESIIFYFSDHGEDIYISDDNYFGHGKTGNDRSIRIGKDIPFMIYTSPKFKEKFPDLVLKIQSSVNRKFNTEDFIYSILDITGYKFKDNNDVERYSLFTTSLE